jgi:hypothetical protein
VVLFWALAMLGLFAHFFDSGLNAGNRRLAHFAPQLLPATPRLGVISAMYFLDPDCSCSRNVEGQINSMQQRYGASLQQFIAAPASNSRQLAASAATLLSAAESESFASAVPALPAVAIWDAAGRLAYFGPLAAGFDCGASGDSFVSANLRRLSRGQEPIPTAMDAVGCFCSVKGSVSSAVNP